MPAEWQFYIQGPTDTVQNPIAGEFFSTEAVGHAADALVREVLQNSLDARLRNPDGTKQRAHVRFFISGLDDAMPVAQARRWFDSLWPHITAHGNGLSNPPDAGDVCPFIVCEDFGTIGLNGDPTEYRLIEGVTNHFLNFFRAEGHSDKGGEDRGSWGVGKTVYQRASRIGSFVALTVRSDDANHFLLGRSTLKYHTAGNRRYKSDGYLGIEREDGLVMPSQDEALLAEFRRDFRLARENQSGLSVAVPWYDVNGDDAIEADTLVAAALSGFFYPILMSHLAVTIATPSGELTFDAETIVDRVASLSGAIRAKLLPLIELTEWARTRLPTEFQQLFPPSSDNAQNWSPEMLPPDVIAAIRQSLAQRQPVAIRVPMWVHPRNERAVATFFTVFVEHSAEDAERPVFVRDELIIPDVRPSRVSQVRSLVIVDDGPIATLLRDAETPAHTHWSSDSGKFKNKYKFGPAAIKFVRGCVSEIMRIVNQADELADPTITIDYFSIAAPSEDDDPVNTPQPRPVPNPDEGPPPEPPPPPGAAPRRFRIDRLAGGFAIRPGDPEAEVPSRIDVRVAYDVRRGNPLKRYNRSDFDLSRSPIQFDNVTGIDIQRAERNEMRLAVTAAVFRIEVRGFDPDRDLYVRATVAEAGDAD